MKRERIIADVENLEDARKVEETIKTGYIEASIETIVNWMGVEEDLASSYEKMGSGQSSPSKSATMRRLADESRANLTKLAELKNTFETMDRARIDRIKLVSG